MTYLQDFRKDNGFPVTVEFTYRAGTDATYSPMNGASGSDPCDVAIIDSWPNTIDFDKLYAFRERVREYRAPWYYRLSRLIVLSSLNTQLSWMRWRYRLTDIERERMEEWLIEHHQPELDYEDDYR